MLPNRFRLVVLIALVLVASLAAAEPGIETVVSTETCNRLWLVPLVWNGDGENPQILMAVFDTCGLSAFIDPDALERISGKRIKSGKGVRLKNMSVAGKSFEDFRLKVRDLDHLSRALGRELDVELVKVGRLGGSLEVGPLAFSEPVVAESPAEAESVAYMVRRGNRRQALDVRLEVLVR